MNTLLKIACKNGAEALGFEQLGTFEKGKIPGINLIQHLDKIRVYCINSFAIVKSSLVVIFRFFSSPKRVVILPLPFASNTEASSVKVSENSCVYASFISLLKKHCGVWTLYKVASIKMCRILSLHFSDRIF